jgi:hypothetical protein
MLVRVNIQGSAKLRENITGQTTMADYDRAAITEGRRHVADGNDRPTG